MLREVLYFEDVVYRLESLMVYAKISNDEVLRALSELSATIAGGKSREEMTSKYYIFAKGLLARAEKMGFSGHLLKQHALHLFLTDVNALSIACNNGVDVKNSTLWKMALKDMGVLQYLMDFDLQNLCDNAGYGEKLYDYTPVTPKEYPELEQMSGLQKGQELLDKLAWCYTNMGCGDLIGASMFRADGNGGFVPVRSHRETTFADISGYKQQIEEIKVNTEAFLKGKPAHTLLLTGSPGIGKYACLSALADKYADKGLKLVEIGKDSFKHIDKLLAELSPLRNKFILIADGLSADDIAADYDQLKYCLGASLEARPKNVLFYATGSHDYPTRYFDEVIEFGEMTEDEFKESVAVIAKKMKVQWDMDSLKKHSLEWVADKHERSAATARDFVNHFIWQMGQS
ncbi:MAG: ATP-binding protein [Defluviitaleaceae bacterium]|nr:ATP-binding protein [Defluviitaleaceae bacterium]